MHALLTEKKSWVLLVTTQKHEACTKQAVNNVFVYSCTRKLKAICPFHSSRIEKALCGVCSPQKNIHFETVGSGFILAKRQASKADFSKLFSRIFLQNGLECLKNTIHEL